MKEQLRNLYFSILPKENYKELIEQTSFYEILGVASNATKEEIGVAYNDLKRRLLIDNIPSTSPTRARFEFLLEYLAKAHGTLTNDETKKVYDNEQYNATKSFGKFDLISESTSSTKPKEMRITDEESLKIIEQIVSQIKNNPSNAIFTMRETTPDPTLTKLTGDLLANVGQMPEYYSKFFPTQEDKIDEIEILDTTNITENQEDNKKTKKGIVSLVAGVMSLIMVFSTVSEIKSLTDNNSSELDTMLQEEDIKITWMRTIEPGDNLIKYANETGVSVEKIKLYNGLSADTIYAYEKIALPLSISSLNIDDLTTTISHENKTLKEIAQLSNTDVETLMNLNKDTIIPISPSSDNYLITSETIQIPNFEAITTNLNEQTTNISK